MNETQKQLNSIVEAYYNDLINTDITPVKNHKYSEKYQRRIKEAISVFDTEKKPKAHLIRRRIILAIVIAALIGTITVAAYEPARKFFLSIFSDHTEVTPAENSSEIDRHKTAIEKKYSITVPAGYVLEKESSVETDEMIIQVYYLNSDRTKSIVFKQLTRELYNVSVDNEDTELVSKFDKNGREILVHNYNDLSTSLIWDDGEYIFELSGEMSESELIDMPLPLKITERLQMKRKCMASQTGTIQQGLPIWQICMSSVLKAGMTGELIRRSWRSWQIIHLWRIPWARWFRVQRGSHISLMNLTVMQRAFGENLICETMLSFTKEMILKPPCTMQRML